MAHGRERRKSERVTFEAKAVVVVEGGGELLGQTRDISIGGVFVAGISAAFGKRVEVQLILDSRTSVRLPGVVRWEDRAGIGIQFALLGARETYVLTEIIGRGQRYRSAL